MKEKTKNYLIKVFWIFMIASFLGCLVELIVCLVQEGHFEIRQGVIYGPFIPVYGAGAVFFYVLLPNLLHLKDNPRPSISKIILYSMVLGGVTEYLFSFCQECLFGTVSWEYSQLPFNMNGRTSLLHCVYWGIGGILFIKLLLPTIEKLDELHLKNSKIELITLICCIVMFINALVSALAGYRQYERLQSIPASSFVDVLLDKHYPDELMDKVFSNKQNTKQLERKPF